VAINLRAVRDLIAERLKTAERDHEEHYGKQKR
jgi:hypothetical protein